MALDVPINGDRFEAMPPVSSRRRRGSAYIVIMDSLSRRERAAARAIIEGQGAELRLLPPCSPDLNPTETAFPERKALPAQANYFRAAGHDADWSVRCSRRGG